MHAIARNALLTAQRPILRRRCKIVSGIRRRNFHRSDSYRVPGKPSDAEADVEADPKAKGQNGASHAESTDGEVDDVKAEREIADRTTSQLEGDGAITDIPVPRKGRQWKTTAGRTKANRPRQSEGLPLLTVPGWFLEKNVKCLGNNSDITGLLAVFGEGSNTSKEVSHVVETTLPNNDNEMKGMKVSDSEIVENEKTPTTGAKYTIHVDVYQEILTTLKANLALRPPLTPKKTLIRPHTVLQCPKDSGTYYLDAIVETMAAHHLEADLIQIDAQDLALIIGPYVDENLAWTDSTISVLGYNSQQVAGKVEGYERDNTQDEGAEAEEEEEESHGFRTDRSAILPSFPQDFSKRIASIINSKRSGVSSRQFRGDGAIVGFEFRGGPSPQGSQQMPPKSSEEQWRDLKISTALDTLIGAADLKRASAAATGTDEALASLESAAAGNLIVQLKDLKGITGTQEGSDLVKLLRSVINKRWSEGRSVILIGTTASENMGVTKQDIQYLQANSLSGETRTIFVPPDRREDQDIAFESDEKARIRRINIRHIEDMIVKLADTGNTTSPVVDIEQGLDNALALFAGLGEAVWTFPRVHRIATTILGLNASTKEIDEPILAKAWDLLSKSDDVKFSWGAAEIKREEDDVDIMLKDMKDSSKNVTQDKIRQIKRNCTAHERRLLGGIIIPADIHTTFGDVHAPKETIEALKTLTGLSLIRPEAFAYGVLATDKIPGLLLYGPPGTGKTLLAKAVAKESGATVLEVSGAEVNDMYVGEGEKNVKAIFSLAKKISPCVVFIDEADAIFAQRSEKPRSSTHRELINQFLREWDGMNEMSAFIMVATNRPDSLDEAVLRRLPRRILVDLPVEKDRESILKIHLKEEILDDSVSLAAIAKNTPYYSGSDLKNLSVAAAFACIREENEAAAKHTGSLPYVFPEKRILTKQHFDKALDEISASISEDMSTLTAIRKFDEKYGDRKGRRKSSGLGFGGTSNQEKTSEGRVRKVEA